MIPFVRETENSVFAPRYVGRALIDEVWSDRRSERGGPSCVVHALFSAKLRGTGEGRGRGERGGGKKGDPSRDDFRWKVEIVCGGRRWPGREREKKKYRTFEISRKKWWKRTVWLLSDLYYLFCSIRFVVFSIFLFSFEKYICRRKINFSSEYECRGLRDSINFSVKNRFIY